MRKYTALTFLELVIVMAIMFILSTISVVVYRSLVDSFSINEVSLTIAQDIRGAQRSAMLLDRESDERWLHGIGIDFREIEDERKYHIFKWCSRFDFYDSGQATLTNEIPNLASGAELGTASLPLVGSGTIDSCPRGEDDDVIQIVETKRFQGYDNLNFTLESVSGNRVAFILFESVSGKTFFYNNEGFLLNYFLIGDEVNIFSELENFELRITPRRAMGLNARSLIVSPVSGIVYFDYD
jgi:type II secretory pathway pseudopilin PulG